MAVNIFSIRPGFNRCDVGGLEGVIAVGAGSPGKGEVLAQGPEERAAFQTVLKRRSHRLLIASVSVQNIRQFVAVIGS